MLYPLSYESACLPIVTLLCPVIATARPRLKRCQCQTPLNFRSYP